MRQAKTPTPEAAGNDSGRPAGPLLLLVLGAALCLLALFQWMDLLVLQAGGSTLCAISDTVNCGTVWTSTFAERIQGALGMPVAGLGLVYGLVAFALALTLVAKRLTGSSAGAVVAALRLTAAVGVLACVTFATASFQMGALCLTCLLTYGLVLAFAGVAVGLLPGPLQPPQSEVPRALLFAGGFAAVAYLALLYPGLRTGEAKEKNRALNQVAKTTPATPVTPSPSTQDATPTTELGRFIASLSPMERKALGDEFRRFRTQVVPPGAGEARYPPHALSGPKGAPIRLTEFTDIKCGHCRALSEALRTLRQVTPPGSFSVEARYFPFDSECNKAPGLRSDGTGTRCAGAKAQICLEQQPDFIPLREKLFDEQDTLTKERIVQLGASGSLSRDALVKCMESPKTQARLDEDVQYALTYNLEGTPLVLVNGREGSPMGAFLFALILTGGNLDAPELKPLFQP